MGLLRCPRCNTVFDAPAGQVVRCASCGFQATTPNASAARPASVHPSVVPERPASPSPPSLARAPPPASASSTPDDGPVDAAAKAKFLVADDSPSIRKHLVMLLRLLTGADETIGEADSPTQAIAKFRRQQPEVVFLDMMMPRPGDGTSVLKTILKERPEAVVVVVTALDQTNPTVLDAISRGARAYLRKPITVSGLQEVLNELEIQSGRFRRVS